MIVGKTISAGELPSVSHSNARVRRESVSIKTPLFLCAAISPEGDRIAAMMHRGHVAHCEVSNNCSLSVVPKLAEPDESGVEEFSSESTSSDDLVAVVTTESHGHLVAQTHSHAKELRVSRHTASGNLVSAIVKQLDSRREGKFNHLKVSADGKYLGCHMTSKMLLVYQIPADLSQGFNDTPIISEKIRDTTEYYSCFAFISNVTNDLVVIPRDKGLFTVFDLKTRHEAQKHSGCPTGFSQSAAEIHICGSEAGTMITCAFDGGLVSLVRFEKKEVIRRLSLCDAASRPLVPSCIMLSLGDKDHPCCRILYGDRESETVSIIEHQATGSKRSTDPSENLLGKSLGFIAGRGARSAHAQISLRDDGDFSTVAVVGSLGVPMTASVKDGSLVIVGADGVRVRDLDMMHKLPALSDFAATADMDENLAKRLMSASPYLLWMASSSLDQRVELLYERKVRLLNELLPLAPGAAAAAPQLLKTALMLRQREVIARLFWSLLAECNPRIRSQALFDDHVDGKPLIARLIQLFPHIVAQVLNNDEMNMEHCGDRASCK
jgi:hypothetical protein